MLFNVLIREFIYRRSFSEASDTHLNSEVQEFISPFLSVRVTTCSLTGIDGAAHTMCVGFSSDQQILFVEVTTSPFESVGQG